MLLQIKMYRNEEQPPQILHPGMLILAVGIVCGAVTLATLATKFKTKKRPENLEHIQVSSISSISELW